MKKFVNDSEISNCFTYNYNIAIRYISLYYCLRCRIVAHGM